MMRLEAVQAVNIIICSILKIFIYRPANNKHCWQLTSIRIIRTHLEREGATNLSSYHASLYIYL